MNTNYFTAQPLWNSRHTSIYSCNENRGLLIQNIFLLKVDHVVFGVIFQTCIKPCVRECSYNPFYIVRYCYYMEGIKRKMYINSIFITNKININTKIM